MKKIISLVLLSVYTHWGLSQTSNVLSYDEYIGYVKQYHPIVKQAGLMLKESEAKLLKAKGAFDPKLELDYDRKKFNDTEYYDKLNATFKIPTWYGIDVKANYNLNSGTYLNPEAKVPEDGLYSVGVTLSLAKGLLINERRATLQQARIYEKQARLENTLLVNDILYEASVAYFNWYRRYEEKKVYENFYRNAEVRHQAVKRSYELGDKPAIDTIESYIAYSNRKLNVEKANLNLLKASLEISNYLWVDDIPIEVQHDVIPELNIVESYLPQLTLEKLIEPFEAADHPKIQALNYKTHALEINRKLQRNNMLPQVDVQYNFLTEKANIFDSFDINNYKTGIWFKMPLFLRKEQADLRLTEYKMQALDLDLVNTQLYLQNQIQVLQKEILSNEEQINIAENIVLDYVKLLQGEERKFELGEGSLFLINTRESKLIENKLKLIDLYYSYLKAKAKYMNTRAVL